MYALEVNDLKKIYKNGVEALKGISLRVEEGDFFALLGPNGAGKSTLIGIISSLVNTSSGETREEMIPIRVDLPAPFGPSRAKKSPSSTRSEIPFRASTPFL